ncbi:MAG: hypothetical protein IKZ58_03615 [Selenomonadaceae bacterium]|nr:hypothetical protein [Selenomonadaceae bacterium]
MDEEEKYERYIPVEQSIIESLLEVREMRAGRMPKPTLEEFFKEIDAEIEAVEAEERQKACGLNTDDVKRWLENAIVEDGKYLIVPEINYKNFDENPNWRPCFYIVKEGYTLCRIGIELAKYIALKENFIEISKDEVKRLQNEFQRRNF